MSMPNIGTEDTAMGSATWPRPPIPAPRTMDSEATLICCQSADLEGTTANESLEREQRCSSQESESGQPLGQDKSLKTDDFGSWHYRCSKIGHITNTHGYTSSKEPPDAEKAIATKVTSESWLSEEHGKDPVDKVELKRDNTEWGDGGGENASAVDLGVREVQKPLPNPLGM